MPYPLKAAAFETQMDMLGLHFPRLCRVTRFPKLTNSVRDDGTPISTTYSFLEIGSHDAATRVTVLIVAGMHAREWAQPDATLSFVTGLMEAYLTGGPFVIPAYTAGGKTFGPATMSAPSVKNVIDKLDIIVVPLANPDGRAYTQQNILDAQHVWWRKNRSPGATPAGAGVDLNRNFDIGWDFDVYYSPAYVTNEHMSVFKDPTNLTFIGRPQAAPNDHHPVSERETENLIWLIENRPITFLLDLHAAGPTVMYPWALESNGGNPDQTFLKTGPPALGGFDGARDGPKSAGYSEYFPSALMLDHKVIAGYMKDKILEAAGRAYDVGGVADTYSYAAAGTYLDYFFSRQFVAASPRRYAFAVEFGDYDVPDEHWQPSTTTGYPRIEREIHAALIGFLESAVNTVPSPTPSGGSNCALTHSVLLLNLAAGMAWLTTVRQGRDRLMAGRRTRRPMTVVDRAYRRASVAILPQVTRRRWMRVLIAYGVLAPLAAVTRRLLRWGAI